MENRQQLEAEEAVCLEQLIKQQDVFDLLLVVDVVCKLQEVRKRAAKEDQNRRIELNKADRELNKKLTEENKQEMEARKAAEEVINREKLEKMKESFL